MPSNSNKSIKDNTNYVFLYGKSGVGKSTFLGAISNYLLQESEYNIVPNISNPLSIAILNKWVLDLNNGNFPLRTPPGSLIQVEAALQDGNKVMPISLLEISGEDLQKGDFANYSIFEDDNKYEGLTKKYEDFILNSNIFILMTSVSRATNEQNYLWQFLVKLHFLSQQQGSKIKAAIIITHWDTLKKSKITVEKFVEEKMKLLYSQIDKNLLKDVEIFPFSVGKVANNQVVSQSTDDEFEEINDEKAIEELSFKYCAEIADWLLDTVEETNRMYE